VPLQSVHVPAPIGGLNTVAPLGAMPESDAIVLVNLVAGGDNGLRTRLGYREWCTGLAAPVRTTIPFTGSKANGSTNKLFAATSAGIYDVTSSSAAPTLGAGLRVHERNAGYVTACVMVTAAGHFLLLCDEENGYYTYTEATTTWTKIAQANAAAWIATTAYVIGNRVQLNGVTYIATANGTSGTTGPTGVGTGLVDGTVTWDYSPTVGGVDPATFCFVMVWKNRAWFVQKDTALAWYLPINSLFGNATAFNLGTKFRKGGHLVGLYNWTYDGGSGIDDSLVAVSGGGDIAIYAGTDPSSASTFGLRGVWDVGAVPAGRQVATNFGGDLLILSTLGILPLSRLVAGSVQGDALQYATAKIANLFNSLMYSYSSVRGWSIRLHPQDNTLLVTVPVADAQATTQLAMSMSTKAWSQYRDLPIYSCEVFGGQLYFGTADGKVCVNTDYLDGVTLADPNVYTDIGYSMVGSFQNLGNGRQKRISMIRATLLSQGDRPNYQVKVKHRYDSAELDAVSAAAAQAGAGLWDSALWDTAVWGGAYSASQAVHGAAGMSPEVAIAIRGTARAKTTIVGFDVVYDVGGFL
jgi:hypothetical protein